jgi:hypothetical protein
MPVYHIAIQTTDAQILVDYLKTRPYVEVAKLIDILLRAPRVEMVKNEEKQEPQP